MTNNVMHYWWNEEANFAAAVGIDRAKTSNVLKMPIYIQGERAPAKNSPFISIFSGIDIEEYIGRLKPSERWVGDIKCVRLPEKYASEMPTRYGALDVSNIMRHLWKFKRDYITNVVALTSAEDELPIAIKTVLGDVFICDFIHGAAKFGDSPVRGFFEWVLQALEVPVKLTDLTVASLDFNSFVVRKVKEVRVEEELDREALDRAVNEKVEKVIESVRLAARSEVAILEAKLVEYDKKLSMWKEEAFKEFIATMEKLPKDWTFTLLYGEPALHYKRKVRMEKAKVADKIYSINDSRLFINDLYIHGLDTIKSARAVGFHPNLGSSGTFCVGDLEGTPTLENLDNLLDLCRCGSVDEGYRNAASDLVRDLIESGAARLESAVFVNEETFEA